MNSNHKDALTFAKTLKKASLKDFANINRLSTRITIGKFELKGKLGVEDSIAYNRSGIDLLNNKHEYTFPLLEGDLQLSLQLYENINSHYKLYCFTKFGNLSGVTFSINLTTEKESKGVIFLTRKIKFSERYKGSKELSKAHRRQKQIVLCSLLRKLGMDVTENNDLILGTFDPVNRKFVDTNKDSFLNDFIVTSILKGHFQGNKGYQLEILPSFNALDYMFEELKEIKFLPQKVIKNKSNRNISFSMRYKVLRRDNFRCVACGRSSEDGIKLHVDHKTPFSLGGLTILSNLQTLCHQCNIGKSNKFIDK